MASFHNSRRHPEHREGSPAIWRRSFAMLGTCSIAQGVIMKSLTYGCLILVTVFNIAFADEGKVAFQEGQFKRASQLLQPSDPVK